MILHTVIPSDAVMYNPDAIRCDGTDNSGVLVKNGALVQYSRQNGDYFVTRLISTKPADYLDPAYAPGAKMTARL